jgi:hypothetical protein
MTEIKQLSRVVGIAGLATVVLLVIPLMAASGQEPRFTGSAAPAAAPVPGSDDVAAARG